MISETQLEPVIDVIDRDPELDHQLKLLDALSHLPLSPTGWRSVSAFANELLKRSLARGDACVETLPLFARIPLASVRRRLRDVAKGPNRTLATAAAIALAEQADPASLSPLLAELSREPSERIAAAVAWLAPQQLRASSIPLAGFLAQPDPIVRMWIAIALAKAHEPGATGDLEPLEQLWDALVRPPEFFSSLGREPLFRAPPEIFHGDPSMVAALLAKARPLPTHVEAFLVGLKNADFEADWTPRSSLVASAREAKILLAGLTTQFDVDGTAISREPATTPWPPADEHRATLAIDVLSKAPWQGLDLNLTEEQRRHLRATPPDTAAQIVEQAIHRLPAEAKTLGDVPAWILGNSLLSLATSLPSSLPLRVASILVDQVIATKISRPALAWTLARAGADVVWKELAPRIASTEGAQRSHWLDWLASISAQLSAPAPYAGAGGAEPSAARVSDLVDDLPKAGALPPAALESMTSAPMPRAPAPETATGARPSEPPRSKPAARYVQGDLYKKQDQQWVESGADLTRGALYRLDVFVAPSGTGQFQAQTPFPDDALKWQSAEKLRLQVVLAILDGRRDAYIEDLLLPREGASSRCEFQFSIPERLGKVRLRIAIMYEGRVLQTSTLDVSVHEKDIAAAQEAIHPQTEMLVHPDLTTVSTLRRFDASLVLNETPTGESALTVAGRKGAYISSLDTIKTALASISNLLQVIANNSKLHTKKLRSPENAQWLGELANEGHWLHRELVDYVERSPVAAQLREAKYLQIVAARPDAVVPLEFVYEYPPPDDSEGPIEICDHAEEALASGGCPIDCAHKRQPHKFVCPMGFWGLSRVIERHVHDPTLNTQAILMADENLASRKKLVLEGPSLLAASKQVPSDRVNELSTRLQQSWRRGVKRVNDWNEWLDAVKSEPALFVVLPHAHGEGTAISLEINGHSIRSSRIERNYVYPESSKASPPIVLLLGCNTAGVADMNTYARHITVFRQAQSAIVLATTAAVVWGADIAHVAEELIEQLRVAAESSEDCFGEVLRDAKRRAVLKSQLVAICLAAVGDADWRLDIPQDAP